MPLLAAVPAGSMVNPCCCPIVCADLPDTLRVTLSDFILCGCFGLSVGSGVAFTSTNLVGINGTFSAIRQPPHGGFTDIWRVVAGSFDYNQLQSASCLADIDTTTTINMVAFVVCNAGELRLTLQGVAGSDLDYPDPAITFFDQYDEVVTLGNAVANSSFLCTGDPTAGEPIGNGNGLVELP